MSFPNEVVEIYEQSGAQEAIVQAKPEDLVSAMDSLPNCFLV